MSCGITYDKDGNIIKVENEQGQPSKLYQEALNATKNEEEAKRIFLVSKTPSFKTDVVETDIKKYQADILKKLSEFKHNVSDLKYKIVKTKGFETIQQIVGDRVVGRIRLKQTEKGYKIDSTLVQPDYQGRGLGTDLYKQAIRYSFKNQQDLLSDDHQTPDAQKVWAKLTNKQIAQSKLSFQKGSQQAQTTPQILNEVVEQLKKTGLADNVFLMSKEEIDKKLKELGVSDDVRKQVIAYHGSPHSFDRFTTEKMGTGEGAQAFGWGLYFTDLESIARNYAEKLANPLSIIKNVNSDILRNNKPSGLGWKSNKYLVKLDNILLENEAISEDAFTFLGEIRSRLLPILKKEKKVLEKLKNEDAQYTKTEIDKIIDKVEKALDSVKKGRNLYKVSLHKGKQPSEYTWLEWDKPLNETQIDKILSNEELFKVLRENSASGSWTKDEVKSELLNSNTTGENLYKFLNRNLTYPDGNNTVIQSTQKDVSLELLKSGIDGVKYPAESISRGATSDTARGFNYVVFDENAITIEEQIQFSKSLNKEGIQLTTNGFIIGKDIYINTESSNPLNTSIHEYGHAYLDKLKEVRPNVYNKGLELTETKEAQPYIEFVKQNQPDLEEGSEKFKNEVLAQMIGDSGERLIKDKKKSSPIKEWLSEVWDWIKNQLGLSQYTDEQVANMTLQEYVDAIGIDLLRGEELFKNNIQQAIQRNNGNPLNLAPNGKPSKLYQSYKDLGYSDSDAERLTAQVFSDNFKNWFGDWQNDSESSSKVVDENGQPLVVYHGGYSSINEFDERYDGATTGNNEGGFFFSDNYRVAEDYSRESLRRRYEDRSEEELVDYYDELSKEDVEKIVENIDDWIEDKLKVVPAFINFKTPLQDRSQNYSIIDTEKTIRQLRFVKRGIDDNYEFQDNLEFSQSDIENYEDEITEYQKDNEVDREEAIYEVLTSKDIYQEIPNYDGIIIYNVQDDIGYGSQIYQDEYIAIDPNQIKSATENIGTFDSGSNDIRYSKSNQEYSLKEVYDYMQSKNYEGETLSDFEIEEAKDVMLINNINDSQTLLDKLTKAFIVNDIFKPTLQSLKTFYSDFEARKALESLGTLKSFYYRLKNTAPFTNDNIESDKRFLRVRSFETNSLGKIQMYNPLIEQEKFRQDFGGIKDETQYEDKSLFEQYSKLNRVAVIDKNNQAVSKSKTKEFLEITLKDDIDGSFRRMINVLLNTPSELWNDVDVNKLKTKIFTKATEHSLDLKSFENLNEKDSKELLTALYDTFENSEFDNLAEVYDKVFSIDNSPKEFVTKDTRPVVKLNEKENDFNLFKKFGLLPLGDRVYLKTDSNEKSIEEVKDILGEPDLKKLKSIDLKGAEDVDIETMQKMVLYSEHFNTLLEDDTKEDENITDETYSDVYREYLKDKDNPKFENLIFTEKGFDYYINKKSNKHNKPKIFTGNYYKVSENEIQADEIVDVIRTQDGTLYYPTSNNVYSTDKDAYRNSYEPITNNQPVEIKKGKNNLDCQ